jgi:hypothetical protein
MLQIGRDSRALGVRNRIVILRCAGRCEEVASRSNTIRSLEKVRRSRAPSSGPLAAAALIVTVPVPLLGVMAQR